MNEPDEEIIEAIIENALENGWDPVLCLAFYYDALDPLDWSKSSFEGKPLE